MAPAFRQSCGHSRLRQQDRKRQWMQRNGRALADQWCEGMHIQHATHSARWFALSKAGNIFEGERKRLVLGDEIDHQHRNLALAKRLTPQLRAIPKCSTAAAHVMGPDRASEETHKRETTTPRRQSRHAHAYTLRATRQTPVPARIWPLSVTVNVLAFLMLWPPGHPPAVVSAGVGPP